MLGSTVPQGAYVSLSGRLEGQVRNTYLYRCELCLIFNISRILIIVHITYFPCLICVAHFYKVILSEGFRL